MYRSVYNRWLPRWRREALRTTLWVVPTLLVVAIVVLFLATYALDRASYDGKLTLPSWLEQSSADAARELLSAIAAAVITVVGVVFSVTIVALTLASQQFGPRMLRNFIRDLGTQISLGALVATFVYDVLVLGSITDRGPHGAFVPHLSVTVALALLLVDLVVLIYFIHHITVTIQLPQVIAGISKDLGRAIELQYHKTPAVRASGPALAVLQRHLETEGIPVTAVRSGYLQFVRYEDLVAIAESTDTVIQLAYRPGHFITAGLPLAHVWPPDRAHAVTRALRRAHVPGAHRTLTQDPVFPIDQLVEIGIRALSPAVNDTFTALTCIDWLSDGLCKISALHLPQGAWVYRDAHGAVRVLTAGPDYARVVNRASDKIRQASRDMPAVAIRQMEGLTKVLRYTSTDDQRRVLRAQADRIVRATDTDVADADDRHDVADRYGRFVAAQVAMTLVPSGSGAGGLEAAEGQGGADGDDHRTPTDHGHDRVL